MTTITPRQGLVTHHPQVASRTFRISPVSISYVAGAGCGNPPTRLSYDQRMSGLSQLNQASWEEAGNLLRACCAAPNWVVSMVAARPYAAAEALRRRGAAELAELDWSQIRLALDAHPRIGERVTGTGAEADWSRREQAGMSSASDEVRAALVQANRDYEQRFGYVFLIFATGRTDTDMLAAAQARLSHSEEQEQAVVRTELGRIVDLRLERLASP